MAEYRSPQQEPGIEKQLFLILGITLVVIIGQVFMSKYMKSPEPPKNTDRQTAAQGGGTHLAVEPSSPAGAPPATVATSSTAALVTKQAGAETETVIESDLYRITFSNRGAQVKSWILKKYEDDQGRPLELVHSLAAPQYGLPLSLYVYDENLRKKLANSLFVGSATGTQNAPAVLTFEYADGDTTARKTFSFDNSYVVRAEAAVNDKGATVAAFPAWPAGFGDQTVPSSYAAGKVDWDSPDKVNRQDAKKVIGGSTVRGPFRWAATSDQYFAAVFLPDDQNSVAAVSLHNTIEIPKNLNKPDPNDKDKVSVLGVAVGSMGGITKERVFVGPKVLHILASVHSGLNGSGPPLDNLVDFGFFGFIAKPLFLWLRWTHEHWVANWGWAILTLTLIINVTLLPLRISTMKSSMKMMKLQPQVNAINEKYKKFKLTDPRMAEKNKEVADLYKREGVNPVGGCLPSILQIPFLFAFYSMLGAAAELRHAHWLWIKDLSSPDPWHLIPILFVVSMFFMQRLTPQAGMDPVQQKMMAFMMPVFLGFISWNLASGLGIYWAAGNLLGIGQQLVMNRTQFGREMRAHIESRARKK